VVWALAHVPLLAKYFTSGEFLYDINFMAVFGAQGKVAAAFGRLRPAAASCVQVDACNDLVAGVDFEVDARYELVAAVNLEFDARLQTEQGRAPQLQPAPASSSRLRTAVAGCGRPAVAGCGGRCSGRSRIRRAASD
jgi:hypothetical protein